jgi:hypothetical protein
MVIAMKELVESCEKLEAAIFPRCQQRRLEPRASLALLESPNLSFPLPSIEEASWN